MIARPVKYDIQTADVPFEDRAVDIHGIIDANGEMILRAEELSEEGIEWVVRAINGYQDQHSARPNWDCICPCHSTGLSRHLDTKYPWCCDKPNTIWPAKPSDLTSAQYEAKRTHIRIGTIEVCLRCLGEHPVSDACSVGGKCSWCATWKANRYDMCDKCRRFPSQNDYESWNDADARFSQPEDK